MKEKIWEHIIAVREKSPLVHNITNYVVMNTSANALLAAGASPVMAHAAEEVEDMVKIASALVINIGTLSEPWVNAMGKALQQANRLRKPAILDPVGAGATPYRNTTVERLLSAGRFDVIRGNASEIIAVSHSSSQTKGVDSIHSSEDAFEAAKQLNEKYSTVVCISGKTDYVIDGNKIARIHNGHEMMTRVTGMGCTATALIGAFAGVTDDFFMATLSAMSLMGVAGELAAQQAKGPGTLQLHFLDMLHSLTREQFTATVKIETAHV